MNFKKPLNSKDNHANKSDRFDKKNDRSEKKFDKKPFNKFKEEKPKTIFDRAFVDPDKEKKKKELDALKPNTDYVFSKSIDDVENPKYSNEVGRPKSGFTKKQFGKLQSEDKREQRPRREFDGERKYDKSDKPFRKNNDRFNDRKEYKNNDSKPFRKDDGADRPLKKTAGFQEDYRSNNAPSDDKINKPFQSDRPFRKGKEQSSHPNFHDRKPRFDGDRNQRKSTTEDTPKAFQKFDRKQENFKNKFTSFKDQNRAYASERDNGKKKFERVDKHLQKNIDADYNPAAKMPLNKYISRSGICSRRDAVELIKNGDIYVNNKPITEPGYKVEDQDVVKYKNKIVRPERDYVYILMNKPKGYITTLDDPKGRRTVADLYADEIQERIFPVGRLDRNTTGLLLLTNDGDLAQQLAHPKYEIKKVYQVKLDKPVSEADIQKIKAGLILEDGPTQVDHIAYLDSADEIGIEIHSGKNRIVRRIFEHLGYVVDKLDRVYYAGLTKKNLPKGSYRKLTRQEIINLKYLGKKKKNIEDK